MPIPEFPIPPARPGEPFRLPPSPPEPAVPPWDVAALAAALAVAPEPTRDPFFGEGLAFRLGPARSVHLALYPAHRAVELTSPDAIVSFRRPSGVRLIEEHVLFQCDSPRQSSTLVVGRDGAASLIVQPLDPDPAVPIVTVPDEEVVG